MKNVKLSLLFLLSVFLITCSSDDTPNSITNSELIGKWRIIMSPLNETKSTELDDEGFKETDFESEKSEGVISFFSKNDFNNHINNHDIKFETGDIGGLHDGFFLMKVETISSNEIKINVYQKDSINSKNTTNVSVINLTKSKNNVF